MQDKEKLLIIEDTKDLVDLLVRKFGKKYDVHAALNAEEGISAVKHVIPDLILLDVNLPDRSGFDVLKELKESVETNDTPVLITTAISDTECVVKGFELGADDYLVKPFNFTELSARINSHLTIRRLRRQVVEMERLNTLHELTVSFNHEINNPLTSITAFAHVLKRNATTAGGGTCPECIVCIEGIISEVGRISEKVRQLSEATKAATVDYQPGIKMIDLENL
jgi:two-component system, sensor histidine kinase and response regulator